MTSDQVIYVGIDPGTKNCALVAWSPNEGLVTTWKPKAKMPTGVERLSRLKNDIGLELIKLAKIGRIERIALEHYSMAEMHGQHASGEVGGIIKLTIYLHFGGKGQRAFPILVAPQQLKKFATGNGNAKKEMVPKEVFKRWKVDFDDVNLAEAYVLARIAHAVGLEGTPGYEFLFQYQKDVVKALEGRTECPTENMPVPMPRRRLVRVGGRGAA